MKWDGDASNELARKLAAIRSALRSYGVAAVRFRGVDWFAWATCGGSSAVLLAAEVGVAEVLVTMDGQYVLTDEIERERIAAEEAPPAFEVLAEPWAAREEREETVRELVRGGVVLSDRPQPGEAALPVSVQRTRWTLDEGEVARYRAVGRWAAEAVTEALAAARPEQTEQELAGAAARALWSRGLEPALTMAAGEQRLQAYRHPVAKHDPLGGRAMLVVCARGKGLYANLTRFVAFRRSSEDVAARTVQAIEAEALASVRPGAALGSLYAVLAEAYARRGLPEEIHRHHQGGVTGYLAREALVLPGSDAKLEAPCAIALNPSLPGTKIEDTFLLAANGALENLTLDPTWPTVDVEGRARPIELVP